MEKIVEKTIKKLKSRTLLFGTSIRLNAARAFIGTSLQEAVQPLAETLGDENGKVREAARQALCSLRGDAIDRLCSLWAETRNKELDSIIIECRDMVSQPPLIQAMISFLIKEKKENGDYENLWSVAKEHPASIATELIKESKWFPKEPSERVLFYFLANDLEKYHDIDPEQSYLRAWYESGGQTLKAAIASRIRKSGDARLLPIFRTQRGSRKKKLSHDEVELQTDILSKAKNYPELFRLLPFAGFEQGVRIIGKLKETGWRNPEQRGRELQERLDDILSKVETQKAPSSYAHVIYQDFRPMFLGGESPPKDETTLLSWVEEKDNFRRRSASVILLAERGSPKLPAAANKASGDAYWQVRMSAAAAELLRPGILSPANKALLGQDHVYWVQAIMKMPQAGSFAEITPEAMEELKRIGKRTDPKVKPTDADDFFTLIRGFIPTVDRQYFLTLAEYLTTDVMVSEEVAYEPGMTDVEIELED